MNTILLRRGLSKQCSNQFIKQFSTSSTTQKPIRVYRYAIDVHGQLFLHDTIPKNLTSCFKNPEFLNFFLTRVRPNEAEVVSNDKDESSRLKQILKDDEWSENYQFKSIEEALKLGKIQGYHWFSPCQGELNLIRSADSPIVFRELQEDSNKLIWAGNLQIDFQPSLLKVDIETGYVYHPSPEPPIKSLRKRMEENDTENHPYGGYSLLSSALVLQRLAEGLEIDSNNFENGKGGSIEWKGKRYPMGIIEDGVDITKSRRHRVDDRA